MRQQCPRCGEEPHPKLTCEEARANRLYEQSEEGQVAVHRKYLTEHFACPACPQCAVSFVDFSNCFAITCTNCATHFCAYCLHHCGKEDAHSHVAHCSFAAKHRPVQKGSKSATYEYFQQDENLFLHYMRCRLPELVRDYLHKALPGDEKQRLRRIAWSLALPEFEGSPYFDVNRLYELMPELR